MQQVLAHLTESITWQHGRSVYQLRRDVLPYPAALAKAKTSSFRGVQGRLAEARTQELSRLLGLMAKSVLSLLLMSGLGLNAFYIDFTIVPSPFLSSVLLFLTGTTSMSGWGRVLI